MRKTRYIIKTGQYKPKLSILIRRMRKTCTFHCINFILFIITFYLNPYQFAIEDNIIIIYLTSCSFFFITTNPSIIYYSYRSIVSTLFKHRLSLAKRWLSRRVTAIIHALIHLVFSLYFAELNRS